MKRFIERIRRRFLPLGDQPSARDVHSQTAIRVFLSYHGSERALGTLYKEGDSFVFAYDPSFASAPDAKPISAFPDLHRTYRSEHLWPFFALRIPRTERQDVREAMNRREIPDDDIFRLLGELSTKAVASPYRFAPTH
jgi:HipA-like protein